MKAKLLITAALAAAVVLCTVGAAAAAKPAQGVTFHLVEKDLAFNYVDNKPLGGRNEPPSLGDTFAFTSTLWTRGDKRAGSLFASCTVASGGKHFLSVCTGAFALKGGQLEVQTTIRDTSAGGRPDEIAIVGGTGAYEGARGMVTSVSRGANSLYSDDTVHLLPKNV